jgi:hypothetical protein
MKKSKNQLIDALVKMPPAARGLFELALSSWLLALRGGASTEQGVVSRN